METRAPLDGNAAGGHLKRIVRLRRDAASVICDGCDAAGEVATARLYGGTMGVLLRCARCDAVVIRLTRTPKGYFLDMQGARQVFVAS